MRPENVVVGDLTPVSVSVTAPVALDVTVPLPDSESIATELPFRSSVAPLVVRLTSELEPKAVVEPAFRVPSETVVAPV